MKWTFHNDPRPAAHTVLHEGTPQAELVMIFTGVEQVLRRNPSLRPTEQDETKGKESR